MLKIYLINFNNKLNRYEVVNMQLGLVHSVWKNFTEASIAALDLNRTIKA